MEWNKWVVAVGLFNPLHAIAGIGQNLFAGLPCGLVGLGVIGEVGLVGFVGVVEVDEIDGP